MLSKSMRLSENWYNNILWVVALLFAAFLIGLGNKVVVNMPKVETTISVEQFVDGSAVARLRSRRDEAVGAERGAQETLEQVTLAHQKSQADRNASQSTFQSWLATRGVTQRGDQDPELIERTRALQVSRQAERNALAAVQEQERRKLDATQGRAQAERQLADLYATAQPKVDEARKQQELRVFLYRLALTLPPLLIAGWLFKTQRKTKWWPFVMGFTLFALVGFFFELAPYLPDYGGYVRYAVGILVTAVAGRQVILALQRYREQQQQAEKKTEVQRREALSHELATSRMAKGACPGCERPVDLKNPAIDFCQYCGIALFDYCQNTACTTRKSAFACYCQKCGTPTAKASAA
jgi:hypothetical protein